MNDAMVSVQTDGYATTNKQVLSGLIDIAAGIKEIRPWMRCVRVTQSGMMATNGHMLIKVAQEGLLPLGGGELMLCKESLKAGLKTFGNKDKLCFGLVDRDANTVQLGLVDDPSLRVVIKLTDERFPNIERVMEQFSDGKKPLDNLGVGLDVFKLQTLCRAISKMTGGSANKAVCGRFDSFGPEHRNGGMRIECGAITAILAPMNM